MGKNRALHLWGTLLTVLLLTCVGIGSAILASMPTQQMNVGARVTAPRSTATAQARSGAPANVTPAFSGNPFKKLPNSEDELGNSVVTYTCAPGLTKVDLPIGKPYTTVGGTKITLTQQSDNVDGTQNSVKVSITLGSHAGLAGMIIHTHAGAGDPSYGGQESDYAYATRLMGGEASTIPLATASYVPDQIEGDTISGVSFCLN